MTVRSARGDELHRLPRDQALALVDRLFGPAAEWPSPLVAYRLTADEQADWKVELGQWLRAAEEFGFLPRVLHEVKHQAKRPSRATEVDPNDAHHLKLHQHMAAARVIHYLTATGWTFAGYETETGGAIDIDCAVGAPGGCVVEFQVKAPDQPGRVKNGRLVDGEYNERVVEAVSKAARQLRRPASGPAIVAVCANRRQSLAYRPDCLVRRLIGSTTSIGDAVYLARADSGWFFTDDWRHISAVMLLDLVRGVDTRYTCTILTNPEATHAVQADWFPRGRVCVLEGDRFRWCGGSPATIDLPDGTRLVDVLPALPATLG